jgi:hypothetical protein
MNDQKGGHERHFKLGNKLDYFSGERGVDDEDEMTFVPPACNYCTYKQTLTLPPQPLDPCCKTPLSNFAYLAISWSVFRTRILSY